MVQIIDITGEDKSVVRQAAELLVDLLPEGWPTIESALDEVGEAVAPDRIRRAAVEGDEVVGWVGGLERYRGRVWELHPLAVRRDVQRQGIGRALVLDLEDRVRARGIHTMFLGADDHRGETSLGGIDLYPDPLAHLQRIRNVRGHQYEFYQKLGYVIVGVVPDANGFGKPDIYMAKRIAPFEQG
jgi:aminoglycoside 6'-N-acetyltransferase I